MLAIHDLLKRNEKVCAWNDGETKREIEGRLFRGNNANLHSTVVHNTKEGNIEITLNTNKQLAVKS